MKDLRLLSVAAVAVLGLSLFSFATRAEDAKPQAMTGVLIDNACGAGQANEAAAAKHAMACAKKASCAASGYQLIVGDKHYKLDEKGNEQAKAYLKDATSTHVTVEGKLDGETLDATSIKAAEAK